MSKSTKSHDKTQSKNALIKLVASLLPGKHNTIPLSLPVAQALGGDLEAAIIFSQCMYWSDRTDDEDGYFYKCYDEWYEETTIKERTCRDRIKKLENLGWIHTTIRHVYNVPKLHTRVLPENFVEDLIESHAEFEQERADRAAKKKEDLRKRREKRGNAPNPCKTSIRQKLPDSSGRSCRIVAAEVAGSIEDTKTITRDYRSETSKYTKSDSGEYADTDESNFETDSTRSGSKPNVKKEEQHGLASPGQIQDKGRRETHETQNETASYAKPWNKRDRLREDEQGFAVLPPANKHDKLRFTTTRLAQYILHQENDSEFELTLPPPGQQHCWVVSKNNDGGRENDVLDPLRLLRSVNESYGSIDFNELLNDCWQASVTFWERPNAIDLFKSNPLPVLFADLLEDYDVEILKYNPEEWT